MVFVVKCKCNNWSAAVFAASSSYDYPKSTNDTFVWQVSNTTIVCLSKFQVEMDTLQEQLEQANASAANIAGDESDFQQH